MFNNAYQNLELKVDLASGGTIAGLKDKIKSILGNKILILCGLLISGVQQLPAVCEPKIYVTQTEEPEDWDEEEQGEFVPEDVYHLEASNIYGYDIAIEDDVVTCTATQSATYVGVEALIEGGTIENAKPLYFHPIVLVIDTSAIKASLYLMLINNDPEAYDTYTKVKTALFSIVEGLGETARIGFTGGVYEGTQLFTPSHCDVTTSNVINLYGIYADGTRGFVNITQLTFQAYDGVNKIN